MSQKKCTEIFGSSDMNVAEMNSLKFSAKYSSIVNLSIGTYIVGIDAERAELLFLKAKMRVHMETRALAFEPKQTFFVYIPSKILQKTHYNIASSTLQYYVNDTKRSKIQCQP